MTAAAAILPETAQWQSPLPPCGAAFLAALARTERVDYPFPRWLFSDILPAGVQAEIRASPLTPAEIGETGGKRETHNQSRVFFSPVEQAAWPICRAVADGFQDPRVVNAIDRVCGTALGGAFLRIEYCLDREGFWLERHTDIGAKLFTLVIYLSDGPEALDWGTDLYDGDGHHVGRAPSPAGAAVAFVPGTDTWHGFERRPIRGVRRSLIVNYVVPGWRSRHELAFPHRPVA